MKQSTFYLTIGINQLKAASLDYQTVVMPYYREEATRTIQSWWKKAPPYHAKKLFECVDIKFNQKTTKYIQRNRYDLIDYHTPQFTRKLFSALRLGDISMNELITVKLMYDALLCFNARKLPKEISSVFSRYQLNDPAGPYQYRTIDYAIFDPKSSAHADFQKRALDIIGNDERFHYYVIDVPQSQIAFFLIYLLDRYTQKFMPQFDDFFKRLLMDFCNQSNGSGPGMSLKQWDESNIKLYRQTIESQISHSFEDRQNGYFIGALFSVEEQLPFLCRKLTNSHNKSSLMSFVIPTIDTFNVLQQLVHGHDASLPIGVVGPVTTRMIRAYDEIPPLAHHKIRSDTQRMLYYLYPTTEHISSCARPLELTHPDAKNTLCPHHFACDDFLLSWHDLFHAWRNGANYKAIVRKLRHLHDETAGVVNQKQGMSSILWTLSDMDNSRAQRCRMAQYALEATQRTLQLLLILKLFKQAGFDPKQDQDDQYLLAYSLCQEDWQALFFHQSLMGHYRTIRKETERYQYFKRDNYEVIYQIVIKRAREVYCYLYIRPDASVPEIILNKRLEPHVRGDMALLSYLAPHYKAIFRWSKNSGLIFSPSFRGHGYSQYVSINSASVIRKTLYESILQIHGNEQSALMDLIQNGEYILLCRFIELYPASETHLKTLIPVHGKSLWREIKPKLVGFQQKEALSVFELLHKYDYPLDDMPDAIRQSLSLWPAANVFGGEKNQAINVLQLMNATGHREPFDAYRVLWNTTAFSRTITLCLVLIWLEFELADEPLNDMGLCIRLFVLLHGCEVLIQLTKDVIYLINDMLDDVVPEPDVESHLYKNIYAQDTSATHVTKQGFFAQKVNEQTSAKCEHQFML
ncbi:MAG: hypothetical protein Q8R24_01075 [Legionellaceae bacterium]|nr:hypothetical protein [Legionellaceae bacterium]